MALRGFGSLAIAALVVACGGNVATGGSGGSSSGGTGATGGSTSSGGTGGSTSSGGTGGSTSTGGTGGSTSSGGTGGTGGSTSSGGTGGTTPVGCTGFADCCAQSCAIANDVHCPGTPKPGCNCNVSGLPADCMSRLTDVYRCILKVGSYAAKCDQNGNLALRCGVCDAEMSAASQVCGAGDFKCAY